MINYPVPRPSPEIDFAPYTSTPAFRTHPAVEVKSWEPPEIIGYERDSSSTGVDIKLKPGDDLEVTASGDLDLQTGATLVQEALARRLATPPYGYTRFAFVGDELIELDPMYGNRLYSLLSGPRQGQYVFQEMESSLRRCAEKELRVENVAVSNIVSDGYKGNVHITLTYQIKSNSEMYQLELDLLGDWRKA